ncbi:acyl-CoA dehydrogenase family protein [Verrucosispora sioxanthis]|uniref:acyl-CoA dehydrogenase family protein n=1 Tax=Verrucosispora sioxanthis TaxID=2499994 RepID=UPI001C10E13B|nr:acyl-CoA dehydrogenase family protein [Verrucosispora sioxanthis]
MLEELGRAVAPVPFLGTVVATRALLACGESTLLRQVAAAERDVALAVGLAARGAVAATAITAALTAGAALLASEQVGVAQWCLDTTVDYVRQRHQFGRPVGSFQAVKHRLADLWVELTEARAVARYAADLLGAAPADGRAVGSEAALAAALAQAYCGPVAVRAAETCVQLHGGLGFTWEHPAHLYLKRAKSTAIAFGTADRHREALARLVDLPGPGTADGVTNRCTGR